jgi:hypothetical protein
MDGPTPTRFRKGVEFCDCYLRQVGNRSDETQIRQIRELRASFLSGLGSGGDEESEYDEDEFKGGD